MAIQETIQAVPATVQSWNLSPLFNSIVTIFQKALLGLRLFIERFSPQLSDVMLIATALVVVLLLKKWRAFMLFGTTTIVILTLMIYLLLKLA